MNSRKAFTIGRALAAWMALALLAACGGGGGPAPPAGGGTTPPTEGALAASQPGELLAYVKSKLGERQAQRKLAPEVVFITGIAPDAVAAPGTATSAGAAAASTAVERSGTVVQEQGVDEDDLIKTDGSVIYTLALSPEFQPGKPSAQLQLHRRAADGSLTVAGRLGVVQDAESGAQASGMLLAAAARRVAVLGATQMFYVLDICNGTGPCPAAALLPFAPQRLKTTVLVDVADVADAQAPKLAQSLRIDGRLVGSRMIGSTLYLVTQHTPELAVEALPPDAPVAERDALLARLSAADLLPTIRIGNAAPTPLVVDTDCYVQPKNASFGIEITTVTAIDLASAGLTRASRCFVGGSEAMYMSPASLYLTTTRYSYTPAVLPRFPSGMTSDVHKFALSGLAIDYRGSGEVEGHLGWDTQRRSYRLSEWNGDLRVLTYTGETGWGLIEPVVGTATVPTTPPSPALLTILRERSSDKTLQPVARLPNAQRPQALGKPGEQVYGVRFLGNRGYVVTFRRIDPLYVLDLSNPADPRAVGQIEMPGFSDYLFPITDGLLLGVGKDATAAGVVSGVKLALFDVADATQPRQLATLVFGAAGSSSGLDYSRHGIDLFARSNVTRVALPLSLTGSNFTRLSRGLQRMEVDTTARTLVARPMISGSGNPWDIGSDRSVQIGEKVYYFNDGQLTAYDW